MVQILPQATSGSNLIGQALNKGLSSGIQQGSDIGFQRGMVQQALGSLNEMGDQANPFDKMKAILGATAGLPDQGRILQALTPYLLASASGKTGGGIPEFPGGQGNIPEGNRPNAPNQTPTSAAPANPSDPMQFLQKANQEFGGSLPEPSFTPSWQNSTLEPTSLGLGPIPPQYTPEQITQATIEDQQRGFPESPRANRMNEYNELSRKRTNDIVQAAQVQADVSEKSAKRQAEFREVFKEELGITDPDDLSVAEIISERPEYKNIANDKIKAKKVGDAFHKYQASRDEFNRGSARPNPILNKIGYENALEGIKSKAKPMIELGQRDKVIAQLSDKGWSETEIAKQLNPLPENVSKKLSSLPSYPKPTENGRITEEPGKAVESMRSFLENEMKPGKFDVKNNDTLKPGNSLVLMRNGLLKKGFNFQEIDREMTDLVAQGKVELDPYQQRELQLMSQSPARTLSLYEIIFGD